MKGIGVIILARYNSNRLPGKALKTIFGKPVLTYIVERVSQVISKERIVLATSDENSDNPIVEFAQKQSIKYYRGSLDNVAERFYNAARENNFSYAVRINGDNIFVDVELLQELINIANQGKYKFITNVKGRTFPKGMSIEIINIDYYQKFLNVICNDNNYKEHVTLFLYEKVSDKLHYYKMNEDVKELSGMQLALDNEADFERSKKIIRYFEKPHWEYNLLDLFEILKKLHYV